MSDARCYTVQDVLEKLKLSHSGFYVLRAQGRLPFLEEIRPRLGRRPRYRADLVDQYLAGEYKPHRPTAKAQIRKFKRSA